MTPRQRVLTALALEQPDQIPVDLFGYRSSGIAAIAYAKLRNHLGFKKKPLRVYDAQQQLAIVDDDVLERFGVDTIELGRGFALDDMDWQDLGRCGKTTTRILRRLLYTSQYERAASKVTGRLCFIAFAHASNVLL